MIDAMKKLVSGLAALLMLTVVVQFYLAASGAFDSAPTEEAFRPHRAVGTAILLLAVVLTVLAALVRMPRRFVGTAGSVVLLVLFQSVIREVSKGLGDSSGAGHLLFGLHGLNGMLIVGAVGALVRQARIASRSPAPEPVASHHVASGEAAPGAVAP